MGGRLCPPLNTADVHQSSMSSYLHHAHKNVLYSIRSIQASLGCIWLFRVSIGRHIRGGAALVEVGVENDLISDEMDGRPSEGMKPWKAPIIEQSSSSEITRWGKAACWINRDGKKILTTPQFCSLIPSCLIIGFAGSTSSIEKQLARFPHFCWSQGWAAVL
jgi:hypothetical protein